MRALPLLAVVLGACASVPAGPPPPPPEQSFRGVKGVALLRRVAWRGPAPGPGETRRRDPLDVLQAALVARGLTTVSVELPERPPEELGAVDQLARRVEWGVQDAHPGSGAPAVSSVGAEAAPVLLQLRADALAVYVRAPGWAAPPPAPSFYGQPLSMAPSPSPASAIALVARDGTVVTFTWGGGMDPLGDAGPVNAAEAVDAALALLAPPAE